MKTFFIQLGTRRGTLTSMALIMNLKCFQLSAPVPSSKVPQFSRLVDSCRILYVYRRLLEAAAVWECVLPQGRSWNNNALFNEEAPFYWQFWSGGPILMAMKEEAPLHWVYFGGG